jgi:hypothetical protein
LAVVFCGEFVVGCVADAVIKPRYFVGWKICQVFGDLFRFFLRRGLLSLTPSPNSMIDASDLTKVGIYVASIL